MARGYHVDGPVLIQVGTGAPVGGVPALQTLGIAVKGVDLTFNTYLEPIYSDAAGPRVPVELQDMGQDANIRCNLVDFDQSVLDALWVLAMGNATVGTGGAPGALIGTNSRHCRVVLGSADRPYRFPYAVIRGPQSFTMGTEKRTPSIEFYAWKFVPAGTNTAAGIVLFDNTAA